MPPGRSGKPPAHITRYQAYKLAIEVLDAKRRQYAFEANLHRTTGNPAFAPEYLAYTRYDQAITILTRAQQESRRAAKHNPPASLPPSVAAQPPTHRPT